MDWEIHKVLESEIEEFLNTHSDWEPFAITETSVSEWNEYSDRDVYKKENLIWLKKAYS